MQISPVIVIKGLQEMYKRQLRMHILLLYNNLVLIIIIII